MKIATWNVNSLRVRLEQLIDWLGRHEPDVVCLQETKVVDADFPLAEIEAAGYQAVFTGQKTFNGVAILAKQAMTDSVLAMPGLDDPQKRVLATTISGVRVINLYVPNGSEVGSEKYAYKLNWLAQLHKWLKKELNQHERLIVVGDFNIAPEDGDVHDPAAWQGSVLVSSDEREALQGLLNLGLVDVFREFDQEAESFSWWDYRGGRFWKNQGLRIDLILSSTNLAKKAKTCEIDVRPRKLKRPSDHAPVIAEFSA